MKLAGSLAVVLTVVLAAPAGAQDAGGKARLDEFSLPAGQTSPAVEQLGAGDDPLPSARPAVDRGLSIPGATPAAHGPVAQLSQAGESDTAPQLSDDGESRDLSDRSVSSARDSRPQPAMALAGQDRCDPQLEAEELDRCRAVIETRAAEFDAPEAPRLSAEQVLLAEQAQPEPSLAAGSSRLSLRLAADDPDADIRRNQELAALYRVSVEPAATRPAEPELPDQILDPSLVEGLRGWQIDVGGATAP